MDNNGYINSSQLSINKTIEIDDMLNELTELQGITYLQDAHDYRSINHRIDSSGIHIHRMIFSKAWLWVMKLTLAILLFLAFFEPPTSTTNSSLITNTSVYNTTLQGPIPNIVLYSIEWVLITIIVVDGLLQAYIFGIRRTLKNPWLIAVFVSSLISYIDLAVSIGLGNLYVFRVRRFFRPFFMIQRSQLMKKVLKSLSKTMGDIFSAFLLLFIWILAFTIISLSTFNGSAKNIDSQYKTFYEAFFSLLVLTTTANNPDAMVKVYNKNRLGFLFFFVFMIVGIFVFMNVLVAIIFNEFRSHILDSMQTSRFRRRIASRALFEVLCKAPSRTTNLALQNDTIDTELLRKVLHRSSISKWCRIAMLENLDSLGTDMINWENLLFVLAPLDEHKEGHRIYNLPKYSQPLLARIQRFLLSKSFEIIGLLICLCNIIVIAIDVSHHVDGNNSNDKTIVSTTLDVFNWLFVLFYVLEQVAKIWAMGFRSYFTKKMCVYDFIITLIIMLMKISVAIVISIEGLNKIMTGTFMVEDLSRITNLIILLRAARITKLFPSLSPIISTLFDVPWRMTAVFGVIIVLFYEYALLGMYMFGGVIDWDFYANQTQPGQYKQLNYGALNFNDFYSSISVLWCLLIVNNWQVFVTTFAEALKKKNSGWIVHVYMISWWIFVVVIVMNCVTAFVIEAYTQQKAFYDEERVRRNRPQTIGGILDESMQYLQQSVVVNESFTFQMLFKNDLIEPTEEQLMAKLKKCRYLYESYPHIKY